MPLPYLVGAATLEAPDTALPGSGGDGAFVLAAPGGVFFSGYINLGHGSGIIYGQFHIAGGEIRGIPLSAPYSHWTTMAPSDFFLNAGSGGGGAGADGQLVLPSPDSSVLALLAQAPVAGGLNRADQPPAPRLELSRHSGESAPANVAEAGVPLQTNLVFASLGDKGRKANANGEFAAIVDTIFADSLGTA
jgi:hypothetical protein